MIDHKTRALDAVAAQRRQEQTIRRNRIHVMRAALEAGATRTEVGAALGLSESGVRMALAKADQADATHTAAGAA
ncbi:hypothetical protein QYN14_25675 [Rhodococcus ruber]|uniref:hypothetical protein n=1 Tax=Rhodococcus ruber TaxID=1830 RepID=UPI00265ACACA|nr:hypothetical protein [Rhodococcus ruber]WKK11939.1 hypothetical protein QYN14_25255 [Rhodococcus ruber]WKK12023.1 hypothetical protein QYN14_25675 [Rhodococcus ruber]